MQSGSCFSWGLVEIDGDGMGLPSGIFTLRPGDESSTEASSLADYSLDGVDKFDNRHERSMGSTRSEGSTCTEASTVLLDWFDHIENLDVLFNDYDGPSHNPRAYEPSSSLEERVTTDLPPFSFRRFTEQVAYP